MDQLRESQARSWGEGVIGDWGLEIFEPGKGLARKSEIKEFHLSRTERRDRFSVPMRRRGVCGWVVGCYGYGNGIAGRNISG